MDNIALYQLETLLRAYWVCCLLSAPTEHNLYYNARRLSCYTAQYEEERTRERRTATRFSALLDIFSDSTSLDDFEHYRGRFQETIDGLISLDDDIHDLLSDDEYEEDIKACEEHIYRTKQDNPQG